LPGDDPGDGNEWLDLAIPTGLGELRNGLVVRAAAAVVAVGGSWGTLSEVALARRSGKAVVVLHGWSVTGPAQGDEPVVVDTAAAAVREVVARISAARLA
jgi:uncharacterized protein (TIGR00725 family)